MSTELDQLRRQNHDLQMRLDAVRRDRDRLYEEVLDLSATVAMLRRKHAGHTGRHHQSRRSLDMTDAEARTEED